MSQYISLEIRRSLAVAARERCGYCWLSQDLLPYRLEICHLVPVSAGGTSEEANLWLACQACNNAKRAQVTGYDLITGVAVMLFNPRGQRWAEHFSWSNDGLEIIGQTPCGRATVRALKLNNEVVLTARRWWVSAGWHPPTA